MSERPKLNSKNEKIREHFLKRNKRFLIPIILTGSIAGAGIAGFLLGNRQVSQGLIQPFPSPEFTPGSANEVSTVILNKAKELNFKRSQSEIDLWEDAYQYQEANFDTSDQETLIEITKQRFFDTLDRMGKSENSRFRDAYDIIKGKLADITTIEIDTNLDGDISPRVTSDLSAITYGVSADFILNRSSALTLATQITAAANQADSMVSYIKDFTLNFPNTDLVFDRDAQLETYTNAYAASSEAFIFESGLLDYTFETPISGVDDRSLEYIKFGMNPKDPRWINYIELIAFNDLPSDTAPQQLS